MVVRLAVCLLTIAGGFAFIVVGLRSERDEEWLEDLTDRYQRHDLLRRRPRAMHRWRAETNAASAVAAGFLIVVVGVVATIANLCRILF